MVLYGRRREPSSDSRGGGALLVAALAIATTACADSAEESRPSAQALSSEAVAHLDSVVTDLDAYWSEVLNESYSRPRVVAYRAGDIPATVCAEGTEADDWVQAPFYCFDDQTMVYDADFLVEIYEEYNPDAASAVLAHEWGHHVQQLGERPEATLQQELQADCLAGLFMGARYGDLTEVTEATNAMLRVAEAGNRQYRQSAWFDRAEHGSPGLRVIAFTIGSVVGVSSGDDRTFCDGYGSYRPQSPIELGDYRLAHLPGFEHHVDATGVTVSGGGVAMRIEPISGGMFDGAESPAEAAVAALSAYASEEKLRVQLLPDSTPVVSDRPHGTLTLLGYFSVDGSSSRIGFFRLHSDKTGAALVIDSAAEISSQPQVSAQDETELNLAASLGRSVENFLCTPSQSGDLASPDYFFSCDLELDE